MSRILSVWKQWTHIHRVHIVPIYAPRFSFHDMWHHWHELTRALQFRRRQLQKSPLHAWRYEAQRLRTMRQRTVAWTSMASQRHVSRCFHAWQQYVTQVHTLHKSMLRKRQCTLLVIHYRRHVAKQSRFICFVHWRQYTNDQVTCRRRLDAYRQHLLIVQSWGQWRDWYDQRQYHRDREQHMWQWRRHQCLSRWKTSWKDCHTQRVAQSLAQDHFNRQSIQRCFQSWVRWIVQNQVLSSWMAQRHKRTRRQILHVWQWYVQTVNMTWRSREYARMRRLDAVWKEWRMTQFRWRRQAQFQQHLQTRQQHAVVTLWYQFAAHARLEQQRVIQMRQWHLRIAVQRWVVRLVTWRQRQCADKLRLSRLWRQWTDEVSLGFALRFNRCHMLRHHWRAWHDWLQSRQVELYAIERQQRRLQKASWSSWKSYWATRVTMRAARRQQYVC